MELHGSKIRAVHTGICRKWLYSKCTQSCSWRKQLYHFQKKKSMKTYVRINSQWQLKVEFVVVVSAMPNYDNVGCFQAHDMKKSDYRGGEVGRLGGRRGR